jgi:hypothetical protein
VLTHHVTTACLPGGLQNHLALFFRHGDGAYLCYGDFDLPADGPVEGWDELSTCFTVDASSAITGKVAAKTAHDAWLATLPQPNPALLVDELEVCLNASTCKRFRSPHQTGVEVRALALDPSGQRALVISFADMSTFDGGATEFADVIEVATGKRVAHVQLSDLVPDTLFRFTEFDHSGRFVNHAVLVSESGTAILVDPVHGKGRLAHRDGGGIAVLDQHSALVSDGEHLSVIDTDTLTQLASATLPGDASGESMHSDVLKLGGGVVVASAGPAQLATFDPATRTLARVHPVPVCPD